MDFGFVKKRKIGLALGGGAALGALHIGVLKALEEKKIKIDYISGTSAGALIAAFYAFGKTPDEIEKLALDLKWLKISAPVFSKMGFLSNDKMSKLIINNIGNVNIEDAKIPLSIVAANINTGEKVILEKGKLHDAVMASACIPGVFKPVKINNVLLVDGGIVESVPISPLKYSKANYIIAVDLQNRGLSNATNLINVVTNSIKIALNSNSQVLFAKPDIHIRPNLRSFNLSDSNQVKQLIELGYNETIKKL
ncbi:MAG: patatin-like phospholipase family protein [Bacteroidota bacterium]|nr:patatin-like phospholipase family protein [Bacteroidota bacterium]